MTMNEAVSHQKVAIVTGASRGIGRAITLHLAGLGYAVVINDLSDNESLTYLAEIIGQQGGTCLKLPGDIGDTTFHQELVDQVMQRFGRISTLINNAGVSVMVRGDMLEVQTDSFDRCMQVNMRGTFFLTQAVAKAMLKQGGATINAGLRPSIVFITSVNASVNSIDRSEYCVSKAGLSMIAQLYALRLADEGISVFEIQPGLIETEMTQPSKPKYDQLIGEGFLAESRWGQPEDIAVTVGTLVEGGLPYTVGQTIRVDGGLSVKRF